MRVFVYSTIYCASLIVSSPTQKNGAKSKKRVNSDFSVWTFFTFSSLFFFGISFRSVRVLFVAQILFTESSSQSRRENGIIISGIRFDAQSILLHLHLHTYYWFVVRFRYIFCLWCSIGVLDIYCSGVQCRCTIFATNFTFLSPEIEIRSKWIISNCNFIGKFSFR